MRDLRDLYVACGGELSEDGTQVSVPTHMKSVDLKLKVIPVGIDFEDGLTTVTFQVLIPDETVVGPSTFSGTPFRRVEFCEEFTLPVSAIELADG